MEATEPILEAIQAITGKTPGEKHKAINKIALQCAQRIQAGQDFVGVISSFNVPGGLEPLVRIKVADILKKHDEVVVALKSEDTMVSYQALKATWFFEGTNQSIFNVDYFEKNVFPCVSFHARSRIIKNMAMCLKVTSVAEEFFMAISKRYGNAQAMPLLSACGEKFILPVVIERKLILPCKMLQRIYQKYPAVVINYFKISNSDCAVSANELSISIFDYKMFLPKLIDEHLDDFIEIYEMHKPWLTLGRKRTKILLKRRAQKFLDDPGLYFRILPKKVVTAELTDQQLRTMIRKMLPSDKGSFRPEYLLRYLKHCENAEKWLLLSTEFEEKYGESLLNDEKNIDKKLMKILPAEERVKQARIKLKVENKWYVHDHEKSWRCYLPISESVPAIKNQISITPESGDRWKLFKQLVFTCRINEDRDALLEVLKYFIASHESEEKKVKYDFLERVMTTFKLQTFGAEYWTVLNDCIKRGCARNEFRANAKVIKGLLQKVVQHNCSNGLPIGNEIDWIVELAINGWCKEWDIATECPKLEEKCLSMMLSAIPKKYPDGHEIWKENGSQALESLIKYIYKFNAQNKKGNNSPERISIRDYPWLREKCMAVLNDQTDQINNDKKDGTAALLRANERDMYDLWLRDAKAISDYRLEDILNILRKEPQRVVDDWKDYLRNVQKALPSKKARMFIGRSRWYQDLPKKFADQCLSDLKDTEKGSTFVTLAILLKGRSFTKVIEPYVPAGSEDQTKSKNTPKNYGTMRAISRCLDLVEPSVSLDLLSRFYLTDFLKLAKHPLMSISYRSPVEKFLSLAKLLLNEDVSLTKHVIRLVCTVASSEERKTFLTDLWRIELCGGIREVVFNKIFDLFEETPEPQTWLMIEECVMGLSADDEDSVIERLTVLTPIPHEYVTNYVKLIFNTISTLEKNGFDPEKSKEARCSLIQNIEPSICTQFPEDYCEELLTKYLFPRDNYSYLAHAAFDFTIKSYLRSEADKLPMRLNFVSKHFKERLREDWDVPHPDDSRCYPMNAMVNNFIRQLSKRVHERETDALIYEVLLESLTSVVPPVEAPAQFSLLNICLECKRAESPKDFGIRIARKVSEIIKILSPEYVMFFAEHLDDFLSSCSHEMLFGTVGALIEAGTVHACMIAASILFRRSWTYDEEYMKQYCKINEVHCRKYPGLSCLLYENRVSVTENGIYNMIMNKRSTGAPIDPFFCHRRLSDSE